METLLGIVFFVLCFAALRNDVPSVLVRLGLAMVGTYVLTALLLSLVGTLIRQIADAPLLPVLLVVGIAAAVGWCWRRRSGAPKDGPFNPF